MIYSQNSPLKNNPFIRRLSKSITPNNAIKLRMWQERGGTLDKMVIILPEKKILYTVVPKAANSMIKYCLWEACNKKIEIKGIHSTRHQINGPARKVSSYSDNELQSIITSNSWYKFTFVRNPYARLISTYKDKILGMGNRKNTRSFLKKIHWNKQELPTFEQFILAINKQKTDAMDWHWMPQTQLLMMDIYKYHFIGKLESFDSDMQTVLTNIGVTAEKISQLLAKEVNTIKNKLTNPIVITKDLAEIIYKKYQDDFAELKYDFDSYTIT